MRTPETTTPPPQRKRGRRLANVQNVRCALADVVRKLEAREIDPKLGNAMVYALATLASVIQGADLEQRLARLESVAAGVRNGTN